MLRCDAAMMVRLRALLGRYGLVLVPIADSEAITGSYWGAPEAGIAGPCVYVRADTPVHSVLHEAAHVICMDAGRRTQLHTDAGGDYSEEDAVCYLQIVLAGELGLSVAQICADMDSWGYTFRLGSAQAWFERDADDAHAWLVHHGLLTDRGGSTFRLRIA
jgi:hypothetical protein